MGEPRPRGIHLQDFNVGSAKNDLRQSVSRPEDLKQRLERIASENSGEYDLSTIDCVRNLIDYERLYPERKKRYRLFTSIEDFILYFDLHPEWHGISSGEAIKDHTGGASSFLQAYKTFIDESFTSLDKAEKQELKQKFFKRKLTDWKSSDPSISDEQVGIKNIQTLFKQAFPGFEIKFPLDEDCKIAENKREEAKKYILDNLRGKNFIRVFGGSCINISITSYFQGSRLTVIRKCFSPLGIQFEKERIINPETGAWVDENNKRWVTLTAFCKVYSVDYQTFCKYLHVETSTQLGRDSVHKEVKLYSESDLLAVIKDHSAVLTGEGGFLRAGSLKRRSGLSQTGIMAVLRGVSQKVEEQNDGRKTVLYSESEATSAIQSFLALPRVDALTGVYVDSDKRRLAPANYFREVLGISHDAFSSYCGDVYRIMGRSKNDRKAFLYDVDEALKRLKYSRYRKKNGEDMVPLKISQSEAREELNKFVLK